MTREGSKKIRVVARQYMEYPICEESAIKRMAAVNQSGKAWFPGRNQDLEVSRNDK